MSRAILRGRSTAEQHALVRRVLMSLLPPGLPALFKCAAHLHTCCACMLVVAPVHTALALAVNLKCPAGSVCMPVISRPCSSPSPCNAGLLFHTALAAA